MSGHLGPGGNQQIHPGIPRSPRDNESELVLFRLVPIFETINVLGAERYSYKLHCNKSYPLISWHSAP
jgi:hypothetical protein